MSLIDRSQREPRSEEEIDSIVAFINAFMDGLDANGSLFDAITEWSPARVMICQQAFFTLNATLSSDTDEDNSNWELDDE